jgi:dynein heavy chain
LPSTNLNGYDDQDNIPDSVLKKVRRYVEESTFQPDIVAKVSHAAKSLCMWTRAIYVYSGVAKTVAPKRAKLAEANAQLEEANRGLDLKAQQLNEIEQQLDTLRVQQKEATDEQQVRLSFSLPPPLCLP